MREPKPAKQAFWRNIIPRGQNLTLDTCDDVKRGARAARERVRLEAHTLRHAKDVWDCIAEQEGQVKERNHDFPTCKESDKPLRPAVPSGGPPTTSNWANRGIKRCRERNLQEKSEKEKKEKKKQTKKEAKEKTQQEKEKKKQAKKEEECRVKEQRDEERRERIRQMVLDQYQHDAIKDARRYGQGHVENFERRGRSVAVTLQKAPRKGVPSCIATHRHQY